MHATDITHDVERIAVLGHAAAAADYLTAAGEAAGVPQREVVAELVAVDTELIVAIAPRLIGRTDITEAGPAANGVVGHDIKAIPVIAEDITRRGRRGVAEIGDGRVVASRRRRGVGRQPAAGD